MAKRIRTPKLIRLDLSKGEANIHPDISLRKTYLCRIDGQYFVGKFERQWYGLNFCGWTPNPVGLQYDMPGTNGSGWEAIWEMR